MGKTPVELDIETNNARRAYMNAFHNETGPILVYEDTFMRALAASEAARYPDNPLVKIGDRRQPSRCQ